MSAIALLIAIDPGSSSLRITRPATDSTPQVARSVELGAMGRHGHQGWIGRSWATFAGTVFSDFDVEHASTIRLRFELPQEWTLAATLPGEGRVRTIAAADGRSAWQILRAACVGAGSWKRQVATAHGSQLRVFTPTHPPLDPQHVHDAEAVWRVVARDLGYTPDHGYTVVWGPPAPDGKAVHGGTGPRGMCMSHDGGNRPLELLAHRLAHAVNRDGVGAVHMAQPRDHWFVEGFATWFEHRALQRAEIEGRPRLSTWQQRMLHELSAHPEWRVPLAAEPRVSGELAEHLHYVRGPVAAHALDQALRERTGRDLLSFMGHLANEHPGRAVDLRLELARWSTTRLDDVFARVVDTPPIDETPRR